MLYIDNKRSIHNLNLKITDIIYSYDNELGKSFDLVEFKDGDKVIYYSKMSGSCCEQEFEEGLV